MNFFAKPVMYITGFPWDHRYDEDLNDNPAEAERYERGLLHNYHGHMLRRSDYRRSRHLDCFYIQRGYLV